MDPNCKLRGVRGSEIPSLETAGRVGSREAAPVGRR